MELTHTFEVKMPIEDAWAKLTSLKLTAPATPGTRLELQNDGLHRGTLTVEVGPVSVTYQGSASITDRDDDAKIAVIVANGHDTSAQDEATAVITAQCTAANPATTKVELVTELTLTGLMDRFASGVLADASTKLIEQLVENLESDDDNGAATATPAAATTDPLEVHPMSPLESHAADLLDASATPVAKRLVPALGLLAATLLIIRILRRRSSR